MAAHLVLGAPWVVTAGLAVLALPLAKKKHIRGSKEPIWSSSHPNAPLHHEPIYCRLCGGTGQRPCTLCNETGKLGRGGFTKRNTVRVGSLVGTQWTSVHGVEGRLRHFLCVAKRGKNVKDGVAVLSSTCGPVEKRIRIEVPVSELKSREIWEGGWTTLKQIRGGDIGAPTRCSACRGEKLIMCPRCDGLGQVGL